MFDSMSQFLLVLRIPSYGLFAFIKFSFIPDILKIGKLFYRRLLHILNLTESLADLLLKLRELCLSHLLKLISTSRVDSLMILIFNGHCAARFA